MNFLNLVKIILFSSMITMVCSCSEYVPSSLNTIPEEANLVCNIDLKSILEKVNAGEFSDLEIFKGIKKQGRKKNRKLYKLIDNMIEKPEQLGVNINGKMFVYLVEEAQDEKYLCISIDLSNKNNFKDFCDRFIDKLDLTTNLEEELNYQYYIIEQTVGIGWDENKALFVFSNNQTSRKNLDLQVEYLMTLKAEDNITNNDLFNKFYAESKDVSLLVNSNLLETDRAFQQVENSYSFDLKDNVLMSYLEFSEEEVVFTTEFLFNEEIEEFISEYKILDNKMNLDMLKYLPQESFFLTSLSINLSEYYELLMEGEEFDAIKFNFERIANFRLEDIFNTIKGNCILSLNDFEEIESTYKSRRYEYSQGYAYVEKEKTIKELLPIYNFILEISDNSLLEDMIENAVSDNQIKKKNNYYEAKFKDKYSVYIAFNDKYLFVSNDKKSINFFLKNGYVNNSKESGLKDNIIDNNFFVNFNLDYDSYPKNIKKEIRKKQNKKEEKLFEIFTDLLKGASIKQIGNNKLEVSIRLKNSDVNSLNKILKTLETNYAFLKEI